MLGPMWIICVHWLCSVFHYMRTTHVNNNVTIPIENIGLMKNGKWSKGHNMSNVLCTNKFFIFPQSVNKTTKIKKNPSLRVCPKTLTCESIFWDGKLDQSHLRDQSQGEAGSSQESQSMESENISKSSDQLQLERWLPYTDQQEDMTGPIWTKLTANQNFLTAYSALHEYILGINIIPVKMIRHHLHICWISARSASDRQTHYLTTLDPIAKTLFHWWRPRISQEQEKVFHRLRGKMQKNWQSVVFFL